LQALSLLRSPFEMKGPDLKARCRSNVWQDEPTMNGKKGQPSSLPRPFHHHLCIRPCFSQFYKIHDSSRQLRQQCLLPSRERPHGLQAIFGEWKMLPLFSFPNSVPMSLPIILQTPALPTSCLKTIGNENAFASKGDAGSLFHFKRMVSKTEACQENQRLNPMGRSFVDEESQRLYGAGL